MALIYLFFPLVELFRRINLFFYIFICVCFLWIIYNLIVHSLWLTISIFHIYQPSTLPSYSQKMVFHLNDLMSYIIYCIHNFWHIILSIFTNLDVMWWLSYIITYINYYKLKTPLKVVVSQEFHNSSLMLHIMFSFQNLRL